MSGLKVLNWFCYSLEYQAPSYLQKGIQELEKKIIKYKDSNMV